MFEINTILTLTLLIFRWAIIVSFALVIYGVFRMPRPTAIALSDGIISTQHRPSATNAS